MKYIVYTINDRTECVIFPELLDFEFVGLTLAEDINNIIGAGEVTIDEKGQFRCEDHPDSPVPTRGLADSTVLNHMDNDIMRQ